MAMDRAGTESEIEVMLVEDDITFRDSLTELLKDGKGLHCTHACDSCEAALSLLENGYVPEIILLDLRLPGMSGIEGVRRFRSISPATQIIMLTVFDDDESVFNAICQGASGYLLKSTTGEQILAAIHDVMGGGAAMSPTVAARVLNAFARYSRPSRDYGLTAREKEILTRLIDGLSKKQLADQLCISPHTVETHLKNIYAKLHVHSQIDVITKTLQEHLL